MELRDVLLERLQAVARTGFQPGLEAEFNESYALLFREISAALNVMKQLAHAQREWVVGRLARGREN